MSRWSSSRSASARPALVPPPPHPSGARPPAVPVELVPKHVAVVMDGNGRWANQRGLPRTEGHEAGEASLLDVVAGAIEIGVTHISAYAFSTENWKRSPDEVRFLMGFNRDVIRRRRDQMHAWGVRVRWAGRRPRLWRSVIDELEAAEQMTRDNDVLTLTMCVNYGGRAEIADAAAADRPRGGRRADSIRSEVDETHRRALPRRARPARRRPVPAQPRASSARRTSCCGSPPTPSWSSWTCSGRTSTVAPVAGRRAVRRHATGATAAPSTPPSPPPVLVPPATRTPEGRAVVPLPQGGDR